MVPNVGGFASLLPKVLTPGQCIHTAVRTSLPVLMTHNEIPSGGEGSIWDLRGHADMTRYLRR